MNLCQRLQKHQKNFDISYFLKIIIMCIAMRSKSFNGAPIKQIKKANEKIAKTFQRKDEAYFDQKF